MVQEAPHPTQYQCIPREIILRSNFGWAEIYTSLLALQEEGFVRVVDADGVRFSVTQAGIDEAANFVEDPTMYILGHKSIE
jgi:hypothetical protein